MQINDTPDSLIPILWHSCGDLQEAVDEATRTIDQAKKDFDIVAKQLAHRYAAGGRSNVDLQEFTDACRANCTGNLQWR